MIDTTLCAERNGDSVDVISIIVSRFSTSRVILRVTGFLTRFLVES